MRSRADHVALALRCAELAAACAASLACNMARYFSNSCAQLSEETSSLATREHIPQPHTEHPQCAILAAYGVRIVHTLCNKEDSHALRFARGSRAETLKGHAPWYQDCIQASLSALLVISRTQHHGDCGTDLIKASCGRHTALRSSAPRIKKNYF